MRLVFGSAAVLLALYGLVFAAGNACLARLGAPIWAGIVFTFATAGIQYWYAPRIIEWLFDIHWDDDGRELPVRNQQFLRRLCAERGLKMPRIGVIHSNTPNAFTFGHWRADARIVVTTGLLSVLNSGEADAVLAHEAGHIEHWDFVVMTLAALAPLMLYQIYRCALRADNSGDSGNSARENNEKGNVALLAGIAYLCYLISEFLVLLLSRTREYFADQYSAKVTGAPNMLASALVKIAYGMVRADGEFRRARQGTYGQEGARLDWERSNARALALMGISNLRSGEALALGAGNPDGEGALMRWDLVNPWARLYELNSTHPLTALRIRALNREAEAMHQKPEFPLPVNQRRGWKTFPFEVILWAAPWLAACVFLVALLRGRAPVSLLSELLVVTGVTWILRTWLQYCGAFRPTTLQALLADVAVSAMQPRAVRLEGTVIGFGVPGAFWCPDLVLQDETGMLFVLYRQSVPFARLFFAISKAESYIGRKVVIEGWFRRGLRPYIEMSTLAGEDMRRHCAYSRWIQHGAALLLVASGLVWWLLGR